MQKRAEFRAEPPASILMVDDNPLGLLARKTVIEELGFEVTTSEDPAAALEMYLARPYDLLVTDYMMPQMKGDELIRRIREAHPAARVILLSGYVEALGLDEQSTGADIVLSKTSREVMHLIRAVERLTGRRKTPGSVRRPKQVHVVNR